MAYRTKVPPEPTTLKVVSVSRLRAESHRDKDARRTHGMYSDPADADIAGDEPCNLKSLDEAKDWVCRILDEEVYADEGSPQSNRAVARITKVIIGWGMFCSGTPKLSPSRPFLREVKGD